VGVAPLAEADRYFARMLPSMRSFAPLFDAHRALIEIRRLRVVLARSGEDVTSLGARTECVLNPAGTALLNGLLGDEVFSGGELMKIVRRESAAHP
jgi:predicted Zn-dependent protease